MTLKNLMEEAIAICGTQQALAQKSGISQTGVSWLLNQAERVSAETAIAIERATDGVVSRYRLRPDLFGSAPMIPASRNLSTGFSDHG